MEKWIITILMILTLFPIASAMEMCENPIIPNQQCQLLTPTINCTSYDYEIINLTGSIVSSGILTHLNESIYYLNLNESRGDYIVRLCDDSTREITVEGGGDNMFLSLLMAVGLFVWLMTTFMFKLDEDHILLKLLFAFLAVLFVVGGLHIAVEMLEYNGVVGGVLNASITLYNASLWVFYLFTAYILFYYVYKLFMYLNERIKSK